MLVIGVVAKVQMDLQVNPDCAFNKPTLLRSLFTVGLLCKNFDFDSENFGEKKVAVWICLLKLYIAGLSWFLCISHIRSSVKNSGYFYLDGLFCFSFLLS